MQKKPMKYVEFKNVFRKNKKEIDGLLSLKRSLCKNHISKGINITTKNSFLAFPPKKIKFLQIIFQNTLNL